MLDPQKVSRFRARSFEVTLHSIDDSGKPRRKILEGQTTSISRIGTGIRGRTFGRPSEEEIKSHRNNAVIVEFHTVDSILENVVGQVKKIGDSRDPRHDWYFGIVFKQELDLSSLGRSQGGISL